ncbi:MAG: HAD hydrolase family protein [Bacillus subtilis]|nr:HAD hydrolase family protein [Bacillus subtilis]
MPKIVCLDIDGTLLNGFGKISEANRRAIERLKAEHHYVVIASGRTYAEIVKIVAPRNSWSTIAPSSSPTTASSPCGPSRSPF